jgi:glycosyltransferase involved in cell wall biosynthesis
VTVPATISVALCTHNGERFVREQLASIFGQTVLPNELVISDDASHDATLSIVADVVAAHEADRGSTAVDVRVLRNPVALGVVGNFEAAINACSGDLIVLSDQDDIWLPDRLEKAVGRFGDDELLLLFGDAELVDSTGRDLGAGLFQSLGIGANTIARVHGHHAFDVLMHRNIATGATTILRRSLVALAFPIPDGWIHDEWLAMVAAATGSVDLTEDRLVRYRQHDANVVGAERLSLRRAYGRMTESGTERNDRLLVRARSLAERLPGLPGVSSGTVAAAERKLAHEQMRSRLTPYRLARVVPVLREYATGRYSRFGRGLVDVVRDLVQPIGRGE